MCQKWLFEPCPSDMPPGQCPPSGFLHWTCGLGANDVQRTGLGRAVHCTTALEWSPSGLDLRPIAHPDKFRHRLPLVPWAWPCPVVCLAAAETAVSPVQLPSARCRLVGVQQRCHSGRHTQQCPHKVPAEFECEMVRSVSLAALPSALHRRHPNARVA